MTIFARALEFIADGMTVGLGSGRASSRFVELLGERVRDGLNVRGVPTSHATAELAERSGVPLVALADAPQIDVTIDGADEVDPRLNLIKGYGRALVREKIIAASSRRLVILVGEEKVVSTLGARGKLPIEVVPFGVPLVVRRLAELGCPGTLFQVDGRPFTSDNGNHVVDAAVAAIADPRRFEQTLRDVPGIVDTGLFLDRADTVLIGDDTSFELRAERQRNSPLSPCGRGAGGEG